MTDDMISRQAAVDALNGLTDIFLNNLPPTIYKEDAIKAVKAQPSVTDTNVRSRATEADDLINRKDTIRAIEAEKVAHGDYTTSSYVGYEFAEEVVESMPSAQPECEDAVSRFEVLRLIDYSSHDLNDAVDNRYMQNEIKQLPSVTPKQPGWIPVTKRLPENEQDVLVTVEIRPVGRKPFRRVVRAFYTDGKHTDADSAYTWYELEEPDFDDDGNIIVPEGWWESSDYSEEVSLIDDFVISWREQPKPQKGEENG